MHHKELELRDLQERLNKVKPGECFRVSNAELLTLTSSKKDNVNNPTHYNMYGIEAIQAIRASMSPLEFQGYLKGNIEKYLWRFRYKNGLEDLKKAQWYLNKLIEEITNAKK